MWVDKKCKEIINLLEQNFHFRLGLLPLRANPRLFEYPSSTTVSEEEISEQDTLRYEIKATCKWNPQAPKDSRRPDDIYCGNNGKKL